MLDIAQLNTYSLDNQTVKQSLNPFYTSSPQYPFTSCSGVFSRITFPFCGDVVLLLTVFEVKNELSIVILHSSFCHKNFFTC